VTAVGIAGKSATVFVYRLPASSNRFDGPAEHA
jgi:hypothetical protein